MKLNQWSFARRIYGITALFCVAILGIAAFNTLQVNNLRHQLEEVAHENVPCTSNASAILHGQTDNMRLVYALLVASTPEEHKQIRSQMSTNTDQVVAGFKALETLLEDDEDRRLFEELKLRREDNKKVRERFLALVDTNKAEAQKLLTSEFLPVYEAYSRTAARLVEHNSEEAEENSSSVAAAALRGVWITASSSLAGTILGLTGVFLVVSRTVRQLRHVTGTLGEGTEQISGAAGQVNGASQQLAEGASEQAASLEETSSSLEEMSSMTKRNSENAGLASQLAGQAREAADRGVTDMQQMSAAMDAIKSSASEVAKIVRTIDEIAFQTNILALNAAVEAARAGEAGMGFAVVADEVRNLAQRSAAAARETASKIEGSIASTQQGVGLSSKVATVLTEIVEKARQVDQLVSEVAAASREQSQGIEQLNTAVSQMDKVTQGNAASAEESASAAQELHSQSQRLRDAVRSLMSLVQGGGNGHAAAGQPKFVGRSRDGNGVPEHRPAVPEPAEPVLRRTQPAAPVAGIITSGTGTAPSRSVRPAPAPRSLSPEPVVAIGAPKGEGDDLVRWDDATMSTGVQTVDDQHKELVRRINELHRAMRQGVGKDKAREMIDFLGDYAVKHFQHEEGVMETHQCPVKQKNCAAHKRFLQAFGELKNRFEFEGNQTRLLFDLKKMVGDWLVTHILNVDTKLRGCTRQCGNGQHH